MPAGQTSKPVTENFAEDHYLQRTENNYHWTPQIKHSQVAFLDHRKVGRHGMKQDRQSKSPTLPEASEQEQEAEAGGSW